ncbi:phage integrase N-terminal SAM-like domain-containing protein [Paraflavitalea sp. CAU 1676]|nr:phage integrase N-terminal SAM-like domain-containing protein [Paraflavitalea sp. CAU 1676]MDF2189352.1 phage integrase N-terminal SAM-like domain-containing protein [Paraflavitalea sp. CAU 1676]
MKTIDLTSYTFRPGMHENTAVIWIHFQYDKSKIEHIKSLKGRWSSTYKCWYLPDTRYFRSLLNIPIETTGKSVLAKLSPVNAGHLQRMKELLQMKAYSQSTIKTYLVEFAQLLYTLKETPVESLHYDRLRAYILYCINSENISENQLHSRLNAIKFYFEQVLHKPQLRYSSVGIWHRPLLHSTAAGTQRYQNNYDLCQGQSHPIECHQKPTRPAPSIVRRTCAHINTASPPQSQTKHTKCDHPSILQPEIQHRSTSPRFYRK